MNLLISGLKYSSNGFDDDDDDADNDKYNPPRTF
jgi:hypothetical protein